MLRAGQAEQNSRLRTRHSHGHFCTLSTRYRTIRTAETKNNKRQIDRKHPVNEYYLTNIYSTDPTTETRTCLENNLHPVSTCYLLLPGQCSLRSRGCTSLDSIISETFSINQLLIENRQEKKKNIATFLRLAPPVVHVRETRPTKETRRRKIGPSLTQRTSAFGPFYVPIVRIRTPFSKKSARVVTRRFTEQ